MDDERAKLESVASWYSSKQGFYGRLVEYGFNSIEPYLLGSTCLELGPADGKMTSLLLDYFNQVTCVDGSKSFCDGLSDEFKGISGFKVECSLFEEYEPSEAFDVVLATHILEHLADPVHLLSRIRNWLSPQGVLIVLVPNACSFHRLVAVKMGLQKAPNQLNDLDVALGHRRVYDVQLLSDHLDSAKWHIVAQGGTFFKPLTNQQMEEWFTVKMMDGFYELGKDFPEYAAEIYAVCQA